MRPIRLVMQAFGPYGGREELDFRRLGDRRFFLIHGPTGGGKTTILDAICFALYGDASGDDRRADEMRSDHADRSTPTEVTFDFSLGDRFYRVTRRPQQERPKKRGTGTTVAPHVATLTALEPEGDGSLREGRVVEAQWSAVTEGVERLLNFRSRQFRQVILLPQGQFRRLLLANSKEREEILQVLFRTEVYRRIEEALKAEAKGLVEEMRKLRERRAFILEQAEAGSRDALEDRRKDAGRALRELAARRKKLVAREKRARGALEAGRALDGKFREAAGAEEDLAGLIEEKETVDGRRERLKQARAAALLRGAEEARDQHVRERAETEERREGAKTDLRAALKAKAEAGAALGAEKKKDKKREAARRRVAELKGLDGKIGELTKAREALERAEERAEVAKAARDGAKEKLDRLQESIGSLEEALEAARPRAARAEALGVKVEAAGKDRERRKRLEAARKERDGAREKHEKAAEALERADEAYRAAREALEALEARWASGQAGVLAEALREGEACPVCGSTEHPRPARRPKDVPGEALLQERRQAVRTLEATRDGARRAESDAKGLLSRWTAEVKSLEEGLGERAALPVEAVEDAFRALRGEFEAAGKAGGEAERMAGELRTAKRAEKAARKVLEKAEGDWRKAEAARVDARAVVKERETALPDRLRSAEALGEALEKAEGERAALEEALDAARERAAAAGETEAACRAALEAAEKVAAAAGKRAEKAEATFRERLAKAGFEGEEEYRRARMDDGAIEALDRAIREYDGRLKAARSRLERARKATKGLEPPDLEALETTAAEATEEKDRALREEEGRKKDLEQVVDWLRDLGKTGEALGRIEREYGVAGRIADVANGKNPEGIAFQRFILSSLLDEVLVSATARLRMMSRERYHLHRVLKRADQRTAGGLDLEVFDSYTGVSRPVSTLSGGESFLASLSLALGLADVVQNRAGGIHLETIFVDEGFGSLDPESLDLALKALIDMQGGRRLVGIISHVPELRERIDVRLEVTATRGGSRARFVGTG